MKKTSSSFANASWVLPILIGLAWPFTFTGPAAAGGKDLPPELGVIPADAALFFHVRTGDLMSCEITTQLQKLYPNEYGQVERALKEIANEAGLESVSFAAYSFRQVFEGPGAGRWDERKNPGKKTDKEDADSLQALGVFTAVRGFDQGKVAANFVGQDAEEKIFNDKVYYVTKQRYNNSSIHFLNARTFVVAYPPEGIKKILGKALPKQTQPLAAALQLAKAKYPLVAGMNLTTPRIQEEKKKLLAEWKAALGRSGDRLFSAPPASLMNLLEVQSAVGSVSLINTTVRAQAAVVYATPEAAARGLETLQDTLLLTRILTFTRLEHSLRTGARQQDEPLDFTFWALFNKQIETALREPVFERRQAVVHIQADCQLDVPALRRRAEADVKDLEIDPVFIQAKHRRESARNLQQIVQGIWAFHRANESLPPAAICSKKDGKALLSWRVAVLPHIGEAELYKQFKLDEAWDSPHNIKLLPRIPRHYQPVGVVAAEPFTTFYQAFVGPNTALEYVADAKEKLGARALHLFDRNRRDGNQIVLAEALEAVPWTKPAELIYDAKRSLPNLGGLFEDGFHAVYLDSAYAQFFNSESEIRGLIVRPRDKMVEKKLEKK